MANPPKTPPSSDIDGVDQDRQRIDRPARADPASADALKGEIDDAKGRPPGGRP